MNKYYPSYYGDFTCLAGACPDSCCKAWEIVIDEETYEKYKNTDSVFGEKIRSCIIADSEGDKCFSLVDGRCPFLNSSGLCDIHIELGEEYTSEICRVHPRFIEEYDGFCEISLSLSCPQAAELIFSQEKKKDIYPVPVYNGDDLVLSDLISSREEILSFDGNILDAVKLLLTVAARDEEEINLLYINEVSLPDKSLVMQYLKILSDDCEILSDSWKEILGNTICSLSETEDFLSLVSRHSEELFKVFDYFVYRYYLKAVNDLDVYGRALFIILSVLTASAIAFFSSLPIMEASRLYSKETEHSTENIDIILDKLSELY